MEKPILPVVIRRRNLEYLVKSRSITKSRLASELGVGRAYISQLSNRNRSFGERAARSIELKLDLPLNSLDSPQWGDAVGEVP